MKLLELYKSILLTGGLVSTDDGYLSMRIGKDSKPATIKGKRMVLPTKEHLANPNWSERVVFHPLAENIMRGESEILERFRTAINARFNMVIGLVAFRLMQIATSTGEHKKLSPEQSEFLSKVKDADEKTLHALESLMEAMPAKQTSKQFIHIFLRRGGVLHGKKVSRLGVVSFPLYQELEKANSEVWGVKMRVKDVKMIKGLLEYMFPNIGTAEAYNRSSNSDVAPFLDALMKSVMALAGPINDTIELFRNQMDDKLNADDLLFESGWVETFENLGVMVPEIRLIPMQAGNEGAVLKEGAPAQTVVSETHPAPQPSVAPAPVPTQPAPPPPANQGWLYGQPHQPAPHPAPMQQQYQPQYAPPQPVRTASGVDFESLVNANPNLRQQIGGAGYQAAPMLMRDETPRWARPLAGGPQYGFGQPAPYGYAPAPFGNL